MQVIDDAVYYLKKENMYPSLALLCICGDSKARMLGSIRVQMVDELPSLISEELASAKSHISMENKLLFIGFVCDCVKWYLLLSQDQTIMQTNFLSEWRALLKRMYKEVFHPSCRGSGPGVVRPQCQRWLRVN